MLLLAGLVLGLAACEAEPPAPAGTAVPGGEAAAGLAAPFAGQTLKVMTHDSFTASDAVLAEFKDQTGADVQFLASGDAGGALNKALLAGDAPLADVFYGVDNTFLGRALDGGLFEPYAAPALAQIPAAFKLDPANGALPVDYADVCLNYDRRWFETHDLAVPTGLEDLVKPAYRDLVAVQNPALSSPGLAFLLTTVAHFGEDAYLQYWQDLMANGLLVVNDWETAYNSEFSGGPGRGERPIVVSYASSPAFEVLYGEGVTAPGTAAMVADGTCFRQVEFVGILKGTRQRALAQLWVDFMLAPVFQADMPGQMFVFPVLPGVALDEAFTRHLAVPTRTADLTPAAIAAGRDGWIRAWTETVLR